MEECELEKKKEAMHFNLAIGERLHQERLAKEQKQEAKRNQEREYSEENEMSGRIADKIKEDKEMSNIQKDASKHYMKVMLQNQIKSNELSLGKHREDKVEKERVERNRLVDLLNAEKQQHVYQQNELLDKISDYRLAKKNFKIVKEKSEKEDDFSFLDEGWQMDKVKKREQESESNRRKQLNIESFNAVQSQMAKHQDRKIKDNECKNLEIEDRHVWEKEYKVVRDVEKNKDQGKKETYRNAVLDQMESNRRESEKFNRCEDEEYSRMKSQWLKRKEEENKEARQPIDRWHPARL